MNVGAYTRNADSIRISPIRISPMQPLKFSIQPFELISTTISLADTSISEEEILDVVGQASNLPDPKIGLSIAVFILVGIAILQFSLGDLTREVRNVIFLIISRVFEI